MALSTNRRAPAQGRRPQDAPSLFGVPSRPAPERVGAELPAAVAQAVKKTPPPKDAEKVKVAPKPPVEPSSEPETTTGELGREVAVAEGRTAADVARSITWLGVTYRPPDVWRERQPSLKEEWEFVMAGSHLPEQGVWRAAARGYAAPAIGLITALHFLIWVLRSPARHATAWMVGLLVAVSAAFML